MSFTFKIPHPSPPLRAHLEPDAIPGLAWVAPPDADELSEGTYHLHIEGRSTRGVEVTWADGRLNVRLLIGSSLEDFALARAVLRAAASRTGALIEPEDRPPVAAHALDDAYGARFAEALVAWGARRLRDLVFENGTLTLLGPRRPFDMGYRLVRALEDAGPEATLHERLADAMRRVQYPPAGYAAPGASPMRLPNGGEVTVALWRFDRGYLFPPAQYIRPIAIARPIFLTCEALLGVPGVRASWADERRLLVEPVPVDAQEDVLHEAFFRGVRPTDERPD